MKNILLVLLMYTLLLEQLMVFVFNVYIAMVNKCLFKFLSTKIILFKQRQT